MVDKWWETQCPICGDKKTVTAQEGTLLKCRRCKLQWDTKLPEYMVILQARDHIRKEKEHDRIQQ